jgi:predicted secreted Zn-dependent protease
VPGTRKISSIALNVKTSITKVRFGLGRVDDENRAMIGRMVKEIQAHEERHRAIIEAKK